MPSQGRRVPKALSAIGPKCPRTGLSGTHRCKRSASPAAGKRRRPDIVELSQHRDKARDQLDRRDKVGKGDRGEHLRQGVRRADQREDVGQAQSKHNRGANWRRRLLDPCDASSEPPDCCG